MSFLDGLFGFQTLLVNGVEQTNRSTLNVVGARSADNGTALSLYLDGAAFTTVKTAAYVAAFGEIARMGAAGPVALTLPSAAALTNGVVGVVLETAQAVTITPATGSETINGAATRVLSNQYTFCLLKSTGAVWRVIAQVGT